MPLLASNILRKLSVRDVAQGYSLAQVDADLSLGQYMSTTSWFGLTVHDLFDEITPARNTASAVDYRCIFLYNASPAYWAFAGRIWIASQVASGATLAIGLDPTLASRYNSRDPQAVRGANAETAPAGVTFSAPTTEETALVIGTLAPNMVRAVWLRRTAANTGAVAPDGATLNFACERVAA